MVSLLFNLIAFLAGDNDVEYTLNQPSLLSDLDSLTEPSLESLNFSSLTAKTPIPPSTVATSSAGLVTSNLSNLDDEMLLMRLIDMQQQAAASPSASNVGRFSIGGGGSHLIRGHSDVSRVINPFAGGAGDSWRSSRNHSRSKPNLSIAPSDKSASTATSLTASAAAGYANTLIDSLQLDLGSISQVGLGRLATK